MAQSAKAERTAAAAGMDGGRDLAVEYRAVGDLIPYARNARTHSAAQVALIAGSIREYGFTNPVLVDGGSGIIAGHGRVLAARKLGLATVPVIELAHLTPAQKRAYILADNKLAEQAGWDKDLLALEVGELTDLGLDLASIGFDAGEIDALLRHGEADPREEEVPPVPEVPVSRPGDLWCLGPHRLLCGDATSAADVTRLLAGVAPHLMVTDPPYGVNYDPAWRNAVGLSETKRTGKVANDDLADWREAWALFPGEVAYVWNGALHAGEVAESLAATGFAVRSQIIWAKERLVLSRGDYHWQHEPCWYAVRAKGTGHWSGDRTQTTLWTIPSRDQDAVTVHGTQKPVDCMRRPILNNSSPGQAIYEPFCGSGTTLIAAETTDRLAHAMELDPAYIDVAVLRWQAFTGKGGGRMMARPTKVLTEAQKAEVETLAAVLNAAQMADYFAIGRTTFFAMMERDGEIAERYKRGKARAIGAIAQGLIAKARGGDTASMIFYLKTQAGWRETTAVEHSVADAVEPDIAFQTLAAMLDQCAVTPQRGTIMLSATAEDTDAAKTVPYAMARTQGPAAS